MPISPAGNLPSQTSASAGALLASGRGLSVGGQSGVASGGGVRGRGDVVPAQQRGAEPSRVTEGSAQVDLSQVGRVRASVADVRDAARAVQPAASDRVPLRSSETLRADASRLVNAINNAARVSAEAAPAGGRSSVQAPVRSGENVPAESVVAAPDANPDSSSSGAAGQQSTPTVVSDRPAVVRQAAAVTRNAAADPSPRQQDVVQAGATIIRSDGESGAGANDNFGQTQALNRIGISVGRDGVIGFDTTRFDNAVSTDRAAVEQTLDRFGQGVEASAERQLSFDGNLERPDQLVSAQVDRADDRAARLEEVEFAVQRRIEAQQQVNQTNNPFLVGGVAAYRGVFAL